MAKASRGSSTEKYNSVFASKLRDLFKENPDVTQGQLAELLGVTRQTVSQYVNGISEPGYDALIKIANHFSVSLDYLLGRSKEKTSDINIQAACKTTGLSETSVSCLHAFVAMNADAIDGALSEDYFACNSHFAYELVNEFIAFAFSSPISQPGIPVKNYISFRQNYSAYQQSASKYRDMAPDESVKHTMRLYQIMEMASSEGFHPLFNDESSNYFLTVFCDQYKSYLRNKYPIDRQPIRPTYMASTSSEEQNGND